jgi:hypothetical protein
MSLRGDFPQPVARQIKQWTNCSHLTRGSPRPCRFYKTLARDSPSSHLLSPSTHPPTYPLRRPYFDGPYFALYIYLYPRLSSTNIGTKFSYGKEILFLGPLELDSTTVVLLT